MTIPKGIFLSVFYHGTRTWIHLRLFFSFFLSPVHAKWWGKEESCCGKESAPGY